MKRFASAAIMAAFSWVILSAGSEDSPTVENKETDLSKRESQYGILSISKKDVDVNLKGRVRQDYIMYDKVYTLRARNDDQLAGFRSKASLDVDATYGRKTFGKSAADARLRLTGYGFWKGEEGYTAILDSTGGVSRQLEILAYVEEAWINLHFGTFFTAFENWFSDAKYPSSLKIGIFPYELGRGIAFGDFPMNIPYLGWDAFNYDDTRTNHPGILYHGEVNRDISYELYYSKQWENTLSRSQTWETINSERTDGRRKWRGIGKDRDLWTAKMDFVQSQPWGDVHVQPYGMYVDSPELTLEFVGDSSARLGTVGLMTEYKKGGLSVNTEIAAQYGHQTVYSIDRNVAEEVTDDNAHQVMVYSHVFTTNGGSGDNSLATSALNGVVNSVANKGMYDSTNRIWIPSATKNGDQLVGATGNYNSNITGNARFRDEYRIENRGYMAAVDTQYEFESVPVKIASTITYLSGDKYPYNTECNKRSRQFIPYGDYNYVGHFVYSQVFLDSRKLPRPVDISLHHQYARNNVQDMGNLAFFGLGTTWNPFKDKKKLQLQSNLLWFWETTTLKKWNKEQSLPSNFVGWDTCNGIWTSGSCSDTGRFPIGWMSCDNASRMLGTELNFDLQYRPVDNCLFWFQLGCFIPGQLYKDLEGQPNERTVRSPKASEGMYGLGHDPVWRIAALIDFKF